MDIEKAKLDMSILGKFSNAARNAGSVIDFLQALICESERELKSLRAQLKAAQDLNSNTIDECETCKGDGYYDERLGGEFFSNPKAPCPDCNGTGEAAPIPAQSSYAQALQLLAESRENFEKQFGFSADADWVYKDLAELFICDLPAKPSPAVDVAFHPKTDELLTAKEFANSIANQQSPVVAAPDVNFVASTLMDAWKVAEPDHGITAHITSYVSTFVDMARAVILTHFAPSPRITEQDAYDIILDFYWFMENFKSKHGVNPSVIEWRDAQGRALLNKLNARKAQQQEVNGGSDD